MRLTRSLTLETLVVIGGLLVGPAGAANIDSNLAVSAAARLNGGGCYPASIAPGLLDMLTLVNPEWAAIDVGAFLPPDSAPVTVHGTVALVKINEGGDFSGDHNTDDQNTFISVDPSDMGLVGTGNVHPQEGVEAGDMEVEWEIGSYPLFAWAGTGDRFMAFGRWIWDCGHPNANPAGSCSTTTAQACIIDADCASPTCPTCVADETCQNVNFNYHSELHPPQAVVVSRVGRGYAFSKRSRGGRRPATRADVWISGDGGGAGDRCLLTHQPLVTSLLSLECFPLSQGLADVNTGDFEFDVPLPPKPTPTSTIRVRVIDRTPRGLARPGVTTTLVDGPPPVLHVTIDMTTPVDGELPTQAGETIIAGWRRDPTPVTRVRVKVTGIEILNPLKPMTPAVPLKKRCSVTTTQDCSSTACPKGETCLTLGGPTPGWQVFLEVNGDWKELTGLQNVAGPRMIRERLRYSTAMTATGTLHIHATGKSLGCLEAQLYGQSLARDLALYGLTDGAACLADTSKDIGTFDVNLGPPDFGAGARSTDYVTQSIGGDGGSCSTTTSRLCLTNDDCPSNETCNVTGGAFKLHYTIRRLGR